MTLILEPDVPIYDFECEKCGHKFDRMMKHSDPTPACPKPVDAGDSPKENEVACGGEVKRLISKSSFHLKGGGWADTGYS